MYSTMCVLSYVVVGCPCGAFLTSKVREYNDAIDMVLPREGRRAI
jgi:hypothetical protein